MEIPIDYQLIHQVDKATFKWQAFDDHRIEVENGIQIKIALDDLLSQKGGAITRMTSPDLNFNDPDSAFYLILGGEEIEEHCREVHNLQVGSCIHTKAGSLPAEYIIHSAQPEHRAYKDQV